MGVEEWKRAAAEAAAKLVKEDMLVGLGSGTTIALVVRALAKSRPKAVFIPSSFSTQRLANELGLKLSSLDVHEKLDIVIDGADEVDPNFNLIKGGGGAHTREKIVASAAQQFVVVVDRTKLVRRLGERMPVPVEVLPFAREYTMKHLAKLGGKPKLRGAPAGTPFVTDNGNYIVDVKFARMAQPAQLEAAINRVPGVVENGIFVNAANLVLVGHERNCAKLQSKKDFLKFVQSIKV